MGYEKSNYNHTEHLDLNLKKKFSKCPLFVSKQRQVQ